MKPPLPPTPFDRVLWIVLDGLGVGALPDAPAFGDDGANTLTHLSQVFLQKKGRRLEIPNLIRMGISHLTLVAGWENTLRNTAQKNPSLGFVCGKASEQSQGKDTTTGHWEMVGVHTQKPFATFPSGFPQAIVDRWLKENQLPGVLGNCAASGTEIIELHGAEHLISGKPILYTSADSVWQIAAHEESFGLDRLYAICQSARAICDELHVSRVIARPFVGDPRQGTPFKRTYNRKDYSLIPPHLTDLDHLHANHVPTLGVGKISNIYAGRGIAQNWDSKGNRDGMRLIAKSLAEHVEGLIFCNLIDFDMLFGHRRDPVGYGDALEEFDQELGAFLSALQSRDLLILTADHGNDPTFRGTDHTREYVPVLLASPKWAQSFSVDPIASFADIGKTVLHALLPETAYQQARMTTPLGQSLLHSERWTPLT